MIKTVAPDRISPFPGWESFSFGYRDLFFGRAEEGQTIAAMLAVEPLSILTGASGTGKTSLIRASVIPNLIGTGWYPIYAQPASDPTAALRAELLAQAVPDPASEADMAQRLAEGEAGNFQSGLHLDQPLSDAKRWYQELEPSDPRHFSIDASADDRIPRIPLLVYVLAGHLSQMTFSKALSTLAMAVGGSPLTPDPTLRDILNIKSAAMEGRDQLASRFPGSDPDSLSSAARYIWERWLHGLGRHGLVLIHDQAEELYTAFGVDRGQIGGLAAPNRVPLHDLSRRNRLFDEIAQFLPLTKEYPLRFCVSLRPEWYTELRFSLQDLAPNENRALHILGPLSRNRAGDAIRNPLEKFRGCIVPDALSEILDGLEGDTGPDAIDPFLLGIVARTAWDFAADAASGAQDGKIQPAQVRRIMDGPLGSAGEMPIPPGTPPAAPGLVNGALLWALRGRLQSLDISAQYDALEMLVALFTASGTRRAVPIRDLVDKPLRFTNHLSAILEHLVTSGLIRRFGRGGEDFADIRHDRLSGPVLHYQDWLLQTGDSGRAGRRTYRPFLDRAIRILLNYDARTLAVLLVGGIVDDPLPGYAREALRRNWRAIAWDQPAARVLLASLLHAGAEVRGPGEIGDSDLHPENDLLELLAALIRESGRSIEARATGVDLANALGPYLLRGALLDKQQLRSILGGDAGIPVELRPAILRSLIIATNPDDSEAREEIMRWTRLSAHLTPPL